MRIGKTFAFQSLLLILLNFLICTPFSAAQSRSVAKPHFSTAVAFDVSPPVRSLPTTMMRSPLASIGVREIRPERGPVAKDKGFSGDAAVQRSMFATTAATIPSPIANFEGLSNQDNFNIYGGRVNPPDPVGDVGPNHYVEMINLAFAVYDKQGNMLSGPTAIGDLWAGFAIDDCTDPSGDPIVLYDQLEDVPAPSALSRIKHL